VYQADAHSALDQLRATYLKSLGQKTSEFSDAMQRRDFPALTRLGHQLKGSGLSYGYPEVSELGARIEEAGQHRSLLLLDPLRVQYEELVDRLTENQPVVVKP